VVPFLLMVLMISLIKHLFRAGEPESERPELHDLAGAGAGAGVFFFQEPRSTLKIRMEPELA